MEERGRRLRRLYGVPPSITTPDSTRADFVNYASTAGSSSGGASAGLFSSNREERLRAQRAAAGNAATARQAVQDMQNQIQEFRNVVRGEVRLRAEDVASQFPIHEYMYPHQFERPLNDRVFVFNFVVVPFALPTQVDAESFRLQLAKLFVPPAAVDFPPYMCSRCGAGCQTNLELVMHLEGQCVDGPPEDLTKRRLALVWVAHYVHPRVVPLLEKTPVFACGLIDVLSTAAIPFKFSDARSTFLYSQHSKNRV